MMDVSDELPEQNLTLQPKDGIISPAGKGFIAELEQESCPYQHENQNHSHTAKAAGQRELQGAFRNSPWSKMENEGVEELPVTAGFFWLPSHSREYGIADTLK
jgi:hypothetical protein